MKIRAIRRALLIGIVVVGCLAASGIVRAVPPTNFQTTQIIGSGLSGPSGFEIAPDGRIFILERTGAVKIYKNGALLATPFVTLPSIASGDRGLIGVAFDPDFTVNHWVYFYYTGIDQLNRLVRFTAATDSAADGPVILYQTTTPSDLLHVGGTIRFGPDGKIYLAIGDNGMAGNAQQLNNSHGKILRINKDGTIPADNPLVGQAGAVPEIWAWGLRNPWRFQFDPVTGFLYDGDVGDATWEEINRIVRGGNYGWPICEGTCANPNFINPIYTYNHNGGSAAVTGGPVYRGSMFPAGYSGRLFFGDYALGVIQTLTLNSSGNATGVFDFDPNAGSVVDLKVAPDGSLYYITYFPGRLYRISYSTTNHVPVASATADITKGLAPLTVHFSSGGSFDPNGDPITFHWDLGDATSSSDPNPTKTYSVKGTYVVELTVNDGTNNAQAIPITIQVGIPPVVTIGMPADGALYRAGDTIYYSAAAVDGVGLDINDNGISTEVLFHHQTHSHPFLGPVTGRAGNFTIPLTGEPSADTWFEIKITGTDTNGLATTKSVTINPRTSNLNFATNPAGLSLTLDGAPVTTPRTVPGVSGFQRTIAAPMNQIVNGTPYEFVSWSDGGAATHTITTGDTDRTFTATYRVSSVNCGTPGTNAFVGCYYDNEDFTNLAVIRTDPAINFDWGEGSPDPIMGADTFSARWDGNFNFNAAAYTFTVTADDGVRLYVDGALVIDQWIDQPPTTYTAARSLPAGIHTIRMDYYEQGGGAVAQLSWAQTSSPPPPTCATVGFNQFVGCYYDNLDLTNLKVVRNDPAINFDWGEGSPDPAIGPDSFSVRTEGDFTFAAATYRFTATADDGVRVSVDGQLVIDKWIDQGATTYTADRTFAAGTHRIKVEYYENTGGAILQVSWAQTGSPPPPTCATVGSSQFAGCYYDNIDLTNLKVTRTDPAINFDWGSGSPDPAIAADTFSARWTGDFTFNAATYRFTASADDGIRVYVDDQLILDKWIDQETTTYTVDRTLTSGPHRVKVEYYENGEGAVAKVSWTQIGSPPPPTCTTVGSNQFVGCYYDNINLTNLKVTRTDLAINFDWGSGSPDAAIGSDTFSAVWQGSFTFEAGSYRFSATADDGVRVSVDGQLVIDKWIDQRATTYTADKPLTAGPHLIKMEYYENEGGAIAKLAWSKITDTTPPTITNITVTNITRTSATIAWTTNEGADSGVLYGKTTALGSIVTNASLVTSRSMNLTGLTSNTKYFYRVRSRDATGNQVLSTILNFTTRL